MGYTVKGKTLHTYQPSRTVTGKAAKAANAWAWELCKAGLLTSWTCTKGEGFRYVKTDAEHRAFFGADAWASLEVLSASDMLAALASIDTTGSYIPAAWETECRKALASTSTSTSKRATAAQLRSLLAELATLELPDDARELLEKVAA